MKSLFFLLAFTLMGSTFAQAATLTVSSGSDDYTDNDVCSLREAITNTNNDTSTFDECVADGDYGADTILLQDDVTYELSLYAATAEDNNATGDLDITASLTITSTGSATIDAADLTAAGYPERILSILGKASITLQNLIFQNGKITVGSSNDDYGSVIYIASFSLNLNIDNCDFVDNTAELAGSKILYGGVIGRLKTATGGSVTIANSSFSNNSVTVTGSGTGEVNGGLVYVKNFDSFTMTDTEVYENTVTFYDELRGGLFYFSGNTSFGSDESAVSFENVRLGDNTVTNSQTSGVITGGLVRSDSNHFTLNESLVHDNTIAVMYDTSGGVIYHAGSSSGYRTLDIKNSTFFNNITTAGSSRVSGTVYAGVYSDVKVAFSTFVDNQVGDTSSSSAGGGAFQFVNTRSTVFKSNIFSGNQATASNPANAFGPNCYRYSGAATVTSLGYNFIDNTANCMSLGSDDYNTDAQMSSALTDIGGPTKVVTPQDSSPVFDLDETCTDTDGEAVTTDQRGAPRADNTCDSGAYEKGTFYSDADGDGYGESSDEGGVVYYTPSATNSLDCDDTNALRNPDLNELCDDIDNDCDGEVDEDFADILAEACTTGVGACQASGYYACGETSGEYVCEAATGTPTDELCDGIDNDCDGSTDEDFADLGSTCSNGVGACEVSGVVVCSADLQTAECNATAGTPGSEDCDDGQDNDCDGISDTDEADCQSSGGGGGGIVGGSGDDDDDTTPDGDDDDDTTPDGDDDDDTTPDGDDDDAGTPTNPQSTPGDDDDDVTSEGGGGGCQLTTQAQPDSLVTISLLGMTLFIPLLLRRRIS